MATDDYSQDLPSSFPNGFNSVTSKLNEAYSAFATATRELFDSNKDDILEQVILAFEIQDFRARENFIRSSKIK